MRLADFAAAPTLAIVLLLAPSPVAFEDGRPAILVATRALEVRPYQVTLPEKVGVLEAVQTLAVSFEVAGSLERIRGEGARVEKNEEIAGLLVTGTPFSFMVLIGIVSLTGIVVNDGIVLVDAINRHRADGSELGKAIRLAGAERLRPVLLTTVTTIAGLLPLTLNIGQGGEFWMPLGVTVISGLFVSTGLTLLVVPAVYELVEGGRGMWYRPPKSSVQLRPGD
jgi:hypothetical protein